MTPNEFVAGTNGKAAEMNDPDGIRTAPECATRTRSGSEI